VDFLRRLDDLDRARRASLDIDATFSGGDPVN